MAPIRLLTVNFFDVSKLNGEYFLFSRTEKASDGSVWEVQCELEENSLVNCQVYCLKTGTYQMNVLLRLYQKNRPLEFTFSVKTQQWTREDGSITALEAFPYPINDQTCIDLMYEVKGPLPSVLGKKRKFTLCLSDVTLIIDDYNSTCLSSKVLLAQESKYFDALFDEQPPRSEYRVETTDTKLFGMFLSFVNTNELPAIQSNEEWMLLAEMAMRFQATRLANACIHKLDFQNCTMNLLVRGWNVANSSTQELIQTKLVENWADCQKECMTLLKQNPDLLVTLVSTKAKLTK